jgi:hypothetical protein
MSLFKRGGVLRKVLGLRWPKFCTSVSEGVDITARGWGARENQRRHAGDNPTNSADTPQG